MPVYRTHGLTIRCGAALPPLEPLAEASADVTVDVTVEVTEGERAAQPWQLRLALDKATISGPGLQTVVRDGRSASVTVDPAIGAEALPRHILGQVLPALLLQRGLFVLHASALVGDGRLTAIAAHSSMGKSTLAAHLVRAGFDLYAEDVTAIDACSCEMARGYAELRLWPDALTRLGQDAGQLPKVHPSREKRSWVVETGVQHPEWLRLDRVVVLEPADRLEYQLVDSSRAALLLMGCASLGRHYQPDLEGRVFAGACAISARTSLVRLGYPDDSRVIESAARAIADDSLGRLDPAAPA